MHLNVISKRRWFTIAGVWYLVLFIMLFDVKVCMWGRATHRVLTLCSLKHCIFVVDACIYTGSGDLNCLLSLLLNYNAAAQHAVCM
jgi:hypothetical protein